MAESRDIKVKVGKKVDEADVGEAKVSPIQSTPPEDAEVEAQDFPGYIQCPWCGMIGVGMIDEHVYEWFRCDGCGKYSKH